MRNQGRDLDKTNSCFPIHPPIVRLQSPQMRIYLISIFCSGRVELRAPHEIKGAKQHPNEVTVTNLGGPRCFI